MSDDPTEAVGLRLMTALADCWNAIRDNHPDVPPVVLLPAPALRRNVLGHFAPLRWSAREEGGDLFHEVVVTAEYLNRPVLEVVETLLHEAAHAMNFARGIRDCTKSQYHNKKFKAAAEELGLHVSQVKHYGFAYTTLPAETAERYAGVTAGLEQVLVHRRSWTTSKVGGSTPKGGTSGTPEDKPKSRSRKAVCACGFIIRVSRKTMESTTVSCSACGGSFSLV